MVLVQILGPQNSLIPLSSLMQLTRNSRNSWPRCVGSRFSRRIALSSKTHHLYLGDKEEGKWCFSLKPLRSRIWAGEQMSLWQDNKRAPCNQQNDHLHQGISECLWSFWWRSLMHSWSYVGLNKRHMISGMNSYMPWGQWVLKGARQTRVYD